MNKKATFGPAGNSLSFAAAGGKSTLQAPAFVASLGLDRYEYQGGNGIRGSEEGFRKLGEAARANGIALSVHAPYYISLSGVDPEKRLHSLVYIQQSVDAAAAMGADIIVVHAGSAAKISREEAMRLAADTLYKALETVNNPAGVRIGVETMGKLNQLGTIEEVIELCKLGGTLSPVVDFGHVNCRELGAAFKTKDDYCRVFDRIGETLGDSYARDLHCHFSKIEYTDKGEKKHLTFKDDKFGPPYEPFAEAIAEYGLTPSIVCESDGTQAEDALALKTLTEQFLGTNP